MTLLKACGRRGHVFATSASPRSFNKKLAMSPSSTVHGGQHDAWCCIYMRHSSSYCMRHSWRTQLGAISLNQHVPAYEYWSVLWYGLGRPVITSESGNGSVFVLFGWRFIFGIIMRGEALSPFHPACHRDSGISKSASLLLLSCAK